MDERRPNRRRSAPPASPLYRVKQFTGQNHARGMVGRAQALGLLHQEALYDESEDELVIRTSGDASAVTKRNLELQTGVFGDMYTESRDMRWVASIDPSIQLQWLAEGVDIMDPDHWPEVRRRLNDPSWRKVRTGLGRI